MTVELDQEIKEEAPSSPAPSVQEESGEFKIPDSQKQKRGRRPKGPTTGIAVSEETLSSDGSPRAKKRRQTDLTMSPIDASVQRAQGADRARKSQVLSSLRKSKAYIEAPDDEVRAIMEEMETVRLEARRKTSGQHATIKHAKELYDPLDDFIVHDNGTDDEEGYDASDENSDDEDVQPVKKEELDESGEGPSDFNGNEIETAVESSAKDQEFQVEGAEQTGTDDAKDTDEQIVLSDYHSSQDELLEQQDAEQCAFADAEDSDAEEKASKAHIQKCIEQADFAIAQTVRYMGKGIRQTLEEQYGAAKAVYEATETAADKEIMEEREAALKEYDADPERRLPE